MTAAHGSATVIRGDARNLPLADASVDLIVTSPPFLNLRSYQDNGKHYFGQIGTGTRDQFLEDLWEVTAECVRVLKPTGSIFVELGDSYTDKSLNMAPHRYAIGCVDRLGLTLRAEIVWSRPNGLPESVTDRVRRSHSVWFHFVKSPRYFAAVDTIREPHTDTTTKVRTWAERVAAGVPVVAGGDRGRHVGTPGEPNTRMAGNPLGKLPSSVWTIATQPLKVPAELGIDHFAAYPLEWPRRIIQGWSPSGICTACGEGRRPVATGGGLTEQGNALLSRRGTHADQTYMAKSGRNDAGWGLSHNISGKERQRLAAPHVITGEACACPDASAPTRPAVVLDPFGGTGTTALVAKTYGRHGISVDMSADYCRLAQWRVNDPGQIAAAMQVEKPAKEIDGQDDLLSLLGGGAA